MTNTEKKELPIIIAVIAVSVIAFLVWVFWPSSPSSDDLARSVRFAMQEQIDANTGSWAELLDCDDVYGGIKVENVSLVHIDGKQYRGYAELSVGGFRFNRPVSVICDGDNFMWELE